MGSSWYLYKNDQQQGPFSREELDQKAQSGAFGPADLVWTEGMENWTRADRVEGLFSAQPHPPAPSPVPPPSPAPTYQPRGPAGHQAGPAPRSGKGGLVVLIVLLAVLFLGGGFLAFNIFLVNGDDAALPAAEVESENGDSGQVTGPVDPAGADVSGLWAPPVEALPQLLEVLPKAGEVPYPPYPGAYVCCHAPESIGNNVKTLPYVRLLTADPVDAVITFYKDQLQGYYHKEIAVGEGLHALWQGDEDDFVDVMNRFIPSISIESALDYEYIVAMPEAQTLITVIYQPTN